MSVLLRTVAIRIAVLATAIGAVILVPTASATTWSPTATKAMTLYKATQVGALSSNTPLTMAIGLKVRNPAALASYARAVDTPGNPHFGQYLTPAEFTAQYAPSAAQVSAVTSYLGSQGFTGISVATNRLYVSANATAAQAEQAFDTTIDRYHQFGKTVYANPTAAQVPTSLSGTVLSVLGLDDVLASTGQLHARPLANTSPATNCELDPTTGEPYGLCYYTPQSFRTAYDAGSLTASATPIAIMAEGDLTGVVSDLRAEEKAFGLPAVPYTIEQVGVPSTDTSGADEFDLDTQYSTGIADRVKHLYIYDTTTLTDSDIGLEFNKWASQDLAKGGSASFGECEATPYADGLMVTNDEVLNEAAAQGQSMHASSGDTGGQSCAVAPTNGVPESGPPEVNYPCSSQYVVCVGGTSLFTSANGSYDTEIGWVAGGGGVSDFESSPYWQACVAPSNAGENAVRGVPDIAMDADENTGAYVYVDGTPEDVGGTSLSSPLALGAWGIMETANSNDLGFAAPLLYRLYPSKTYCNDGVPTPPPGQLGSASVDPTYPFHDVDLGSNGPYPAAFGWDYVTGLGTYDIAKVAAALKKTA